MIEQPNDKLHQKVHSQMKEIKHRKKWEYQQTLKYCQFIQNNRQTLEFSQKKLKQRIYNKMAACIGTRSTHQCRSHHQKVLKRYSTIDQFIKAFKQKTQKPKQEQAADNQQNLNDSIQQNPNSEKNIKKLKLGQFQKETQFPINVLTSQKFDPFRQNASFLDKKQITQQTKPGINFKHVQLGFIPTLKITEAYPNFHPFNQNEYVKKSNFVEVGLNKKLQNSKSSFQVNEKMRKNIIVQTSKIDVEKHSLKEKNEKKTFHHNIQKCKMINEDFNEKSEIKSQNVVQNQNGDQNKREIKKQNKNLENAGFFKNTSMIGSLPPYIALSNTLKFLMSNSNWICESILKKQNSNIINPLIKQNLIQLTEKKINIFGNQDEYYRIWVEYVKTEQQNSSMDSMELSESQVASSSQAASEPTDDDLRRRIRKIFNETLIEYGLMLNCYPQDFVSDEINFYLPEQDKIYIPSHFNNTEMLEETPPSQRGFTPLSPSNGLRQYMPVLKANQSQYTGLLEKMRLNKLFSPIQSQQVKKQYCQIQSSLNQIIIQSHVQQPINCLQKPKKSGDLAQTKDSSEQNQEKPVFCIEKKRDLAETKDSENNFESRNLNRQRAIGQQYQKLNKILQQQNQSLSLLGIKDQKDSSLKGLLEKDEIERKRMESNIIDEELGPN